MMISPEAYVEAALKGKSQEEVFEEIEIIRKEIKEMKEQAASSEEDVIICPSPEVKISVMRDYLAAARNHVTAKGWEYIPSEEEKKDAEFNGRLENLESILVFHGIQGETKKAESRFIGFTRDGKIDVSFVKDNELKNLNDEILATMTRDDFIYELKAVHVGEWDYIYSEPGKHGKDFYSIAFHFIDGTKQDFHMEGPYPYNLHSFLETVRMEPID